MGLISRATRYDPRTMPTTDTAPETLSAAATSHDAEVAARVRDYFARHPRAMTMVAARKLVLPEADLLRYMPGDGAVTLDTERMLEMLERLAEFGEVHVIVSNGAATVEVVGTFGGFSRSGGFFNVQTETLDMHIRAQKLGAAFAVRKPAHVNGVETLSLQFFDHRGASAFKVFLTFGNQPSDEVRVAWEAFRDAFRVA